MSPIDRRAFLGRTWQAGLAAGVIPRLLSGAEGLAAETGAASDRFCAFTESFQSWPIPKVCENFRKIGLDGLDLTVRPGGHLEPEQAADQLPEAAKAAAANEIRILMLTTAINEADPIAERILATCGQLGIDRVKLGYFRYKGFGSLLQQIDDARSRIERIAKLAHKHNVLPCVHIHSGANIPASGPASYLLLKDFKPGEVGAYVDPMHMTIEGGADGWRQGLDLLAPWIAVSSMKNFIWIKQGRDKFGQGRWEIRKCPVADGIAPIPEFMATLQTIGYHGLYSMHSEYQDERSWKKLTVDESLVQTKIDLDYVKGILRP